MLTYTEPTGADGTLRIDDATDARGTKEVYFLVQSNHPVFLYSLPWTYSLDGVMQPWESFYFRPTTSFQQVGYVNLGRSTTAETITLHLGDTGDPHLGGPTDFTITLAANNPLKPVSIKDPVTHAWVKAYPYLNVDGVWTPVQAWAKSSGVWKPTS